MLWLCPPTSPHPTCLASTNLQYLQNRLRQLIIKMQLKSDDAYVIDGWKAIIICGQMHTKDWKRRRMRLVDWFCCFHLHFQHLTCMATPCCSSNPVWTIPFSPDRASSTATCTNTDSVVSQRMPAPYIIRGVGTLYHAERGGEGTGIPPPKKFEIVMP